MLLSTLAVSLLLSPGIGLIVPPELEELDRLNGDGKFSEVEARAKSLVRKLEAEGRGETIEAATFMRYGAESIVRGGRNRDPEALRLAQRASDILERLLPPGDAGLADGYHTLGMIYQFGGDLSQARLLAEKALSIDEKALGPDNFRTAEYRGTYAAILIQLGLYADALPQCEKVVPAYERAYGSDSNSVAQALSDLGVVHWYLGELAEAKPLLERSLDIRIRRLGETNRLVAASMHNLGLVLAAQKDYEAALAIEMRALAIREKTWPAGHPNIANGIHTVGTLYLQLGRPKEAEPYMARSLEMRRERLGDGHPDVAQAMVGLAAARYRSDPAQALDLTLEAQERMHAWTRAMIRGLSEREAVSAAGRKQYPLMQAVGLLAAPEGVYDQEARRRVWDAAVRSRGMVLDEMVERKRLPVNPELAELRGRYARLLAARPGSELETVQAELERAERAWSASNAAARAAQVEQAQGLACVAAALPKGAALVAFTQYLPLPPDSRNYIGAFTLWDGQVSFTPLGDVSEIEKSVKAWRAEIAREASSPGRRTTAYERDARVAGESLRKLVWDPLQKKFGAATRVFVVPEGSLHLVNFAALPMPAGRYQVETGPLVHVLNTERDLARPRETAKAEHLFAMGDPDFGSGKALRAAEHRGCADPRNEPFLPLPASRTEVDEVLKTWQRAGAVGEAVAGAAATEDQFKKRAPGNRVVHLATHGFFYEEGCGTPLALAGIALAGANRRSTDSGVDDGILTAEEIALLHLEGVEWAVLSGCDTGLGLVKTGEGVFGLRRAFQLAGASTVIMSLWPVNDQSARDWMRALYQARIVRHLETAEAVRAANLAELRRLRSQGKSPHPLYWGGFVAAGSWR